MHHNFDGANDGTTPYGELKLDPAIQKFYGTTHDGGPSGRGTIFSFGPATGAVVALKSSFDGYYSPHGSLVISGGLPLRHPRVYECAVFRMAMDGTGFVIVHSFADFGSLPQPITVGADGRFYGRRNWVACIGPQTAELVAAARFESAFSEVTSMETVTSHYPICCW